MINSFCCVWELCPESTCTLKIDKTQKILFLIKISFYIFIFHLKVDMLQRNQEFSIHVDDVVIQNVMFPMTVHGSNILVIWPIESQKSWLLSTSYTDVYAVFLIIQYLMDVKWTCLFSLQYGAYTCQSSFLILVLYCIDK